MRVENLPCGYATAFAPGLTDPDIAAPEEVVAASGKGVVKRYNVYRNNVTVSLIDALAAIYPATQRITGVEFFRAMARFHVRATPPASPLLFVYGRDFPAFIESYDTPVTCHGLRIRRASSGHGWMPIMRLTCLCFLRKRWEVLSRRHWRRCVSNPHPAVRIVRSPYPAVAIFAMNRFG